MRNERHSFNDKPAVDWGNGDEEWYKNGERHRLEGPAAINTYKSFISHRYYQNDLVHRILKPAYMEYRCGLKSYECYYLKGNLHNPIGPAEIYYGPNYKFRRAFYIHDKKLSFNEFMKQLEERLNI